jgi:hypothetical protein
MLKAIGFWITSLKDEMLPAPQELVGSIATDVRTRIADYLEAGARFTQYRGYSWCRFVCGVEHSSMGSWDLTDGTWVWPEGLTHYVREHGIVLPQEFITHAMGQVVRSHPEPTVDVDTDYWVQWCASRRSVEFLDGMSAARATAEERASADREARLAALRAKGESESPCVWSGCDQRALLGMQVCARHSLSPGDDARLQIALYAGLQAYLMQHFGAAAP